MKVIMYVHAPEIRKSEHENRGIISVTRLFKDWERPRSKKQRLESQFLIDLPGTWWENEWNCHADGCDHPCKSLEEAISWGMYIYDCPDPVTGEKRVYEFRKVGTPFNSRQHDPSLYNLEDYEPMSVDYPKFKAQFEEENRRIEENFRMNNQ